MIDIGLPSYVEGMTGDKSLSKAVNRGLLLNILREEGSISRASLAKVSGLNKATVSSQIAELIEMGIVRETGTGDSGLGRKPVMLEIDGSAGFTLGISIITESLHVTVMDLSRNTVMDELVPISSAVPAKVFQAIFKVINRVEKTLPVSRYGLTGIGIAVPGVVDKDGAKVVRSAKLDWTNVELRSNIEKKYSGILHIGNDATLATIAERECYNSDSQDLVCVLLDEGIGSGAYINGAIHYGFNGKFGEVGHMTIAYDGPRCPCGNYGCWDMLGSEFSLRRDLAQAGGGVIPSQEMMVKYAAEMPAWSRDVFDRFAGYTTAGVVSLINAFGPSSIVINSDILRASEYLFDKIKSEVENRTMTRSPECEIKLSVLGKTAPTTGACIAVAEKFYHGMVVR